MLKAVTVYANISIADEVVEIFTSLNIACYTQWPRIVGKGKVTEPRFDNHVWPGANTGFHTVVDEETANKLMDKLQEFRASETGQQSGIYAFMTSVERALI